MNCLQLDVFTPYRSRITMRQPRRAVTVALCVLLCVSCVEADKPPQEKANQGQQASNRQTSEQEQSKQTGTQSGSPPPVSATSHDATQQQKVQESPPSETVVSRGGKVQENSQHRSAAEKVNPSQQPKPVGSGDKKEGVVQQNIHQDGVRTPRGAPSDAHVNSGATKEQASLENRKVPQQETPSPTPKTPNQEVKTESTDVGETPTHVKESTVDNTMQQPAETDSKAHVKGDEGLQKDVGTEPNKMQSDDDTDDGLLDILTDSDDVTNSDAGGDVQHKEIFESDHRYLTKLHENLLEEPDIIAGNPDLADTMRIAQRREIYKSMGLIDPIPYEHFDMDEVAEIFTKKSKDGTLRTIMLFHPEPSGRRKMHIYRQRMLEGGDVWQDSEEYSEILPQFAPDKTEQGRVCSFMFHIYIYIIYLYHIYMYQTLNFACWLSGLKFSCCDLV